MALSGFRWSRLAAPALIASLLAACAGEPLAPANQAGASLVISPTVWAAYQEYDRIMRPGAFAVSADGTVSGYSYCPETRCIITDARPTALESCREAGGVDCLIFAIRDDIRVAYRVSADLPTADVRPILVFWDGFDGVLPGEIVYRHAEQGGSIRILLAELEAVCVGSYRAVDQAYGSWTVSCPDGLAASGSYAGLGTGEGSQGQGVDSQGRQVRFRVGPAE